MSMTGIYTSKYQGGLCYALCQETFAWFLNNKFSFFLKMNL